MSYKKTRSKISSRCLGKFLKKSKAFDRSGFFWHFEPRGMREMNQWAQWLTWRIQLHQSMRNCLRSKWTTCGSNPVKIRYKIRWIGLGTDFSKHVNSVLLVDKYRSVFPWWCFHFCICLSYSNRCNTILARVFPRFPMLSWTNRCSCSNRNI